MINDMIFGLSKHFVGRRGLLTLPFMLLTCCSIDMYRQFQADLYRLRLETARKYVGVLSSAMTPISTSQSEPISLHAEV